MMKKVSIVMCTYNGEKYLSQQLDSILNQTYPIYELYIQDDGSSDSTIEIIEEYQKKHPIIHYSVNSEQKGINENFYSALEKVKGNYIAIADQDDIWLPEKIEKEMNCIGDNYLCFCLSEPFGEGKELHFDSNYPNFGLMRLSVCNVVSGHTILMKKELLQLLQYKNKQVYYDCTLALLAAAHNKITFCNEILCRHRRLNDSATFNPNPISPEKTVENGFYLLSSALKKRRRLKNRANEFFSEMHLFLSKTNGQSPYLSDAMQLTKLLSKQGFFSTLQAMILCVKRRDEIFYKKDNNALRSIARAMCHPFLCYHYL